MSDEASSREEPEARERGDVRRQPQRSRQLAEQAREALVDSGDTYTLEAIGRQLARPRR